MRPPSLDTRAFSSRLARVGAPLPLLLLLLRAVAVVVDDVVVVEVEELTVTLDVRPGPSVENVWDVDDDVPGRAVVLLAGGPLPPNGSSRPWCAYTPCCICSIIGRNAAPPGVLNTMFGRSTMCVGMCVPSKNMATASLKLLQLFRSRSYVPALNWWLMDRKNASNSGLVFVVVPSVSVCTGGRLLDSAKYPIGDA